MGSTASVCSTCISWKLHKIITQKLQNIANIWWQQIITAKQHKHLWYKGVFVVQNLILWIDKELTDSLYQSKEKSQEGQTNGQENQGSKQRCNKKKFFFQKKQTKGIRGLRKVVLMTWDVSSCYRLKRKHGLGQQNRDWRRSDLQGKKNHETAGGKKETVRRRGKEREGEGRRRKFLAGNEEEEEGWRAIELFSSSVYYIMKNGEWHSLYMIHSIDSCGLSLVFLVNPNTSLVF